MRSSIGARLAKGTGHAVRSGDRVALWLPKSLEAIISIWGVLKAGQAPVVERAISWLREFHLARIDRHTGSEPQLAISQEP